MLITEHSVVNKFWTSLFEKLLNSTIIKPPRNSSKTLFYINVNTDPPSSTGIVAAANTTEKCGVIQRRRNFRRNF